MNPCTIASCHGKPVCHECKTLGYFPTALPTERFDMHEVLLAIKDALPAGSRLSACGTIAVITLGDYIPDPADLDAGVRFLRAMKRVKEKAPDL
jgi:hypothetical protein